MNRQQHMDFRRFRGVLPRHKISDPAYLKKLGYVVKENRLMLCASAASSAQYWAPDVCPCVFEAVLSHDNRVLQHVWQPITAKEFEQLRQTRDGLSGDCPLVFAWLPLPKPVKQDVSAQEALQAVKTLDQATGVEKGSKPPAQLPTISATRSSAQKTEAQAQSQAVSTPQKAVKPASKAKGFSKTSSVSKKAASSKSKPAQQTAASSKTAAKSSSKKASTGNVS